MKNSTQSNDSDAFFPLTPALSLGERENRSPSFAASVTTVVSPLVVCLNEIPSAGDVTKALRINQDGQVRFPLPEGEGKGEGKRRYRIAGPRNSSVIILATLLFLALVFEPRADLARSNDFDYETPTAGSYKLSVIKTAADGAVVDSRGRSKQLRELTRGRVTVMSFIYTRCASPKACPYATGVLMQMHQASAGDTALAKNLRLISMSFDPEGDSVKRMADYAKLAEENKSAAEWHFLTTRSQVELQPILDGYGQAVDRRSNPNDPAGPLNHTLRVYLIDREGRIRNIYSSGTLDPRLVLADVKTLLMESEEKQVSITPKLEPEARPSVHNAAVAKGSTQP